MKLKITIDAGEVGCWEVVNVSDYFQEMKENRGEEIASSYFQAGTFEGKKVEEYNGKHYVYGYMESLTQSDRCPDFLYEPEVEIKIVIEVIAEAPRLVKCENCQYCSLDYEKFSFDNISYICKKDKRDLQSVEDSEKMEVECDAFKSKYIEYPLTISGIEKPKENGIVPYYGEKEGSLVKIRPCADEYKDKTFLGIFLGQADIGMGVSHYANTGKLHITRYYNPAIFVPELKKVIYGCESWWKVIKNEEELKDISDNDIENVWYVQLLKSMQNE